MAVEVGSAYVSIIPSARGFGAALSKELDVDGIAGSSGESAGARFSGGFIPHLAKIGAVATAAAVAIGAVFGGKLLVGSIHAASDLNEAMTEVGAVFGDSAGDIQDWSKTAATGFGQSKTAALQAAAGLGNFFQGMGLTQTAAVGMSKGIVELAGDIASFANVDPAQALQDLQSGLAGEVEPLRKYGISLDEVSLKQKAQQLGLSDGKSVLTASAKAQAAYAIILESSSRITGDFDRTSTGLANQQRIMSAQWTNLKAEIGQGFLPATAEAANVITTKLLPALTKFADVAGPKVGTAIADFIAALDGVGAADTAFGRAGQRVGDFARTAIDGFKKLADFVTSSGVQDALDGVAQKARELFDLIKNNQGVFDALIAGLTGLATGLVAAKTASSGINLLSSGLSSLSVLLPLLTTPVGIAAVAIGGLAAAAVLAYKKVPLFHDAVNNVAKAFKEGGLGAAVDEAGNQFGRLWDVVQPKLGEFLGNLGGWIKDHATDVKDKFGTEWGPRLWDWIQDTAIPALLEKLPPIIDAFIGWVRDNGPKLQEAWGTVANAFWDWIETKALPQLQEKLPIITAALTQFAVENIPRWGALLGLLFLDAIGRLAVLFVQIVGQFVLDFPQQLVLLGLAIIGGLAVGIAQAWNDKVVPFFTGLPGAILGLLGDVGSWLLDTGSTLIHGLWNGIQNAIGDVISFFANLPGNIISWLGDTGSTLSGQGSDLIHGLYNGIQNVIGDIISFFANLPGNIISWLGGTGSTLSGQGSDLLHGLLNGINNVVGEVASFFANLPGNIVSWLGYLGSLLTGAGGDVISGFINGIESWMSSIAGHIASIPGHVTGAIGYLGDLLYSKGQEIVQGLIDGVESLAGRAESAVARVVSAAAAAIPGVSAIQAGLNIAGLAVGGLVTKPTLAIVGESGPEYVIPADKWASNISPLPAAYAAGMPGSASTGNTVNANVNVQSNADPWRIANEVAWAMRTSGV